MRSPRGIRTTEVSLPYSAENVVDPPSASAHYAASRFVWSGSKPRLNGWLTTSSAMTLVCHAGQAQRALGATGSLLHRLHDISIALRQWTP